MGGIDCSMLDKLFLFNNHVKIILLLSYYVIMSPNTFVDLNKNDEILVSQQFIYLFIY